MKNLCRAALLAFAFALTLVPAGQSQNPHVCHEGAPCTTYVDCGGCPRCSLCSSGTCFCL